jgi:hypothetical protein
LLASAFFLDWESHMHMFFPESHDSFQDLGGKRGNCEEQARDLVGVSF